MGAPDGRTSAATAHSSARASARASASVGAPVGTPLGSGEGASDGSGVGTAVGKGVGRGTCVAAGQDLSRRRQVRVGIGERRRGAGGTRRSPQRLVDRGDGRGHRGDHRHADVAFGGEVADASVRPRRSHSVASPKVTRCPPLARRGGAGGSGGDVSVSGAARDRHKRSVVRERKVHAGEGVRRRRHAPISSSSSSVSARSASTATRRRRRCRRAIRRRRRACACGESRDAAVTTLVVVVVVRSAKKARRHGVDP